VREARGPLGQITKPERLVAPVGVGDADRDATGAGVPVQALDGDVQRLRPPSKSDHSAADWKCRWASA
jgi:hypothetical protein